MRILLGLLLCLPACATTTLVGPVEVSNTQAVLRIRTDQSGGCVLKVSEANVFDGGYAPVHDVDTALFSGADQCSREGNISVGNRWTLVIGTRAVELADDDRNKVSRALQAVTTHYYSIAIGSDTLTGSFTTGNVPLGLTRNDVHFDRNRPGEYQYPSIDWTPEGKATKYIDPTTGVALRRAAGPGELFPLTTTGRAFDTPTGGTGWTGSVYTGVSGPPGTWLRLRATTPSPTFYGYQSIDVLQLVATLSGTATEVEVCLTNDGATCAGALISKTITATPTAYTFGTTVPILDSWMNSPVHPSSFIDIQPRTGNVTKSGTSVAWNSGDFYNPHWGAGSIITIGGTDCVVASLTHEKTLELVDSACKADGAYAYVGRIWGFLIRAKTAGTLTVASPSWNSVVTGAALMGSFGSPRMCSPVKYDEGYLCSSAGSYDSGFGSPIIYWFGDDGTVNPLGIFLTDGGGVLDNRSCAISEGVVWDLTVPGKYWCVGVAGGVQVVYSVQYSGGHAASVIPHDSLFLPEAVPTIRSAMGGISAEVSTFSAADTNKFADFSCFYGWRLIGRQGSNLMLNCLQMDQDSPAWLAVYSTVSNTIIAATCTYCGQPMAASRWGVNHTQILGGDTDWTFVATNPYLLHSSAVTSGTLTSSLSACPANTPNPEVEGITLCSTVTLESLQPLYMGSSLYGQNWELGDVAAILSGGSQDSECARILAFPSGTQVTLLRSYHPYAGAACGTGVDFVTTKTNHTGTLSLWVQPSAYKEWWWNFIHDAHGQDALGTYIREDPDSADCHEIFELGIYVIGCLKDRYVTGVPMRSGNPPESFSSTLHVVNSDGGFMGSIYTTSQNCNEHHPSLGQVSAILSEQIMVLDLRPYICDLQHATSEQMAHVTGRIYKMSAAASADLQYREQGFVVGNGTNPMVDVSPAALTDTQGDEYKYCYVIIAGDCDAGSIVGEAYFNVPIATTGYETGQRLADFPFNTLRDINLTQNGQTLNSLMQVDGHRASSFGEGTRRLSSAFASYRNQNTFWNGRALPDNSRAYFQVDRMEGVRSEIMVADLPPWPSVQSTNRGTGVPLALSFGGVSGDAIRVRFGYAENGLPSDLKCHERQVACATDASGALPFVWTDETQHWAACDSGCTVNVPAISGRVLYYVVDRKNGSTTVSGGINAELVP